MHRDLKLINFEPDNITSKTSSNYRIVGTEQAFCVLRLQVLGEHN